MKEFNKVIGYEDIKIELNRIINMMLDSKKYEEIGAKTPNGLLLHGEPGVGKTLMAKCFIKASKRKTFTIKKDRPDGDFVNYIKKTFKKAETNSPSIVFLDDMDKFANEDSSHKNAEEFVTIQSCIDECKDKNVFVIATTNDLDCIPDSLIRPGRFDKTIIVDNPEREDAIQIIKYYLKGKKCDDNVNPEGIARLLDGRSCASLETVINEAGIYAAFDNRKTISMNDIVRSFMRVVYEAPEKINQEDNEFSIQFSYHEAGHALIAEILEPNSVPFITIKKHQGKSEGFVHIDNNKNYFYSKKFMENRVLSILGGKAASEIVFGITDVGCNEDLERAHRIVRRFVGDFCALGFDMFERSCARDPEQIEYTRSLLVSYEMERYYLEAKRILIENREKLDKLAQQLNKKKVLLGYEIQEIIK